MTRAAWTVARYLDREKRFTVHVELPDGRRAAAHTNNTGRLTGCVAPGARCWLSPATNPARKLRWTLEVSEAPDRSMPGPASAPATSPPIPLDALTPAPGQVLVGVNTATPSRLVADAVAAGLFPELADCVLERPEVRYPADLAPGSRADLLLRDAAGGPVWIEIKNATLVADGTARFPDAPTARGRKHLDDLIACVQAGQRAALVLCVQRADAHQVAAAAAIDPAYAAGLERAAAAGVVCLGLRARVTPNGITPERPLPVLTSTEEPS